MTTTKTRNPYSSRFLIGAGIILLLSSLAGALFAEEATPEIERFYGTLITQNAPAMGVARITITIERWTTDEERKKLVEAIRQWGTKGLVDAMEDMEAGYMQVENNLRWPIRVASSWMTEKGRMIRIATNRPINFVEVWRNTRSFDYPVGVAEMLLPPEGKGEGILLAATQIEFNDKGQLEVKSMPQNTGPQKITNVEQEIVKPKKSKKK